MLCRNCEPAFPSRSPIDGRLLGILRMLARMQESGLPVSRLPLLTRHQTDPINRLLASHIQHLTGRGLRVRAYVM